MPTIRTTGVLSAAIALLLGTTASADLVVAYWINANNFHCKRSHMPDLDQRRDNCCGSPGLPGDGSMYCVPTGTMNLFCYAANHGFPWLAPGPGNWNFNALYPQATNALAELGGYMGTTPGGGTGGSGWNNGSQHWLDLYGAGLLTRTSVYLNDTTVPTVGGMTLANINGGIVAFGYGRYDIIGTYQGAPLLSRTGGHVVTFNEAKKNASEYILRYRDPADSPADASQSAFVSKEVNVTPLLVALNASPSGLRAVQAIDYPSSDGSIRMIDGYLILKPIWFLSFKNTGGTFQLQQLSPFAFSPSAPAINMGPIFGVRDLQIALDGETALAIVDTSAAASIPCVRVFNLVAGTYTDLSVTGMQRLTTGPDGRIYCHDGSKLYCFKPDGTLENATSSIPTPTALAFDDVNKQVVLLSVAQRRVARYGQDLTLVSSYPIPTSMPMSGDGSVIVNPLDQHVFFSTDATAHLGEISGLVAPFTFTQQTVSGLSAPQSLGASDDGKLFVSTASGLRVLKKIVGGAGGWVIDTTSPLHNLDITGRMCNLRSRSNIDPAVHDAPGWNNILAEDLLPIGNSIADCTGDIDGDNDVDGADIGRLLASWGSNSTVADLNGDGTVNGADLGALLAQWGPCP